MLPIKRGEGTYLKCRVCGYILDSSKAGGNSGYVVHKTIERKPLDKIAVVGETKIEVLPKTKIACPKCGNDTAYYWEIQTRSADEPATRFFKCIKCGHVWREYQ